jgi:WD40 repeat protein/tRNA A-37 threonylcarbamoyl transferase component Bud32
MSHPGPDKLSADRNLLFGILALQMDFISRDSLIAAMNAWVLDKAKPLGQILVEQQALAPKRLALLESLVEEHLNEHGRDPQRSLAAVDRAGIARVQLDKVADSDVQASLARVFAAPEANARPSAEGTIVYQSAKSSDSRFVILRPHAKGGLGEVFVALDEELNREVALKAISASSAQDAVSRARFIQEAEITGRLEHPGIVPVYSYGEHQDGRPYYAMRFIKGETLKQAIQRFHNLKPAEDGSRALALRKLLAAFLTVCQAIHYAHSRGILHRDLKPDNIMLGKFGETLVVDWGLAKPIGQRESPADATERSMSEAPLRPVSGNSSVETQAGATIGTPGYMSPEQGAGRVDLMGPATDVYGLGATLYCLLTGKAPFEGGDLAEVLQRVQKGSFRLPRTVDGRIAAPLDAICTKSMALAPHDRYASAKELAEDLEHWLADEPVKAYSEPRRARLARWGRRHRPVVAGAMALLLTAVIALSLGLLLLGRAKTQIQDQRDQADAHLYRSLIGEARAIREAHGSGYRALAWKRLEQASRLATPEKDAAELRQEAGACLGDFVGLDPTDWKSPPDIQFIGFDLHPGGELLAIMLWGPTASDVLIRNVVTGQEVARLPPEHGRFTSVKFSADGKKLFAGKSNGTVKMWQVDAAGAWVGAKTLVAAPQPARFVIPSPFFPFFVTQWEVPPIERLAVSPDGTKLAACFEHVFATSAAAIFVWDLAADSPAPGFSAANALPAGPSMLRSVAFSPKGDLVAGGFGTRTSHGVLVWDVATHKVKHLLRPDLVGFVYDVGFSPDGRSLACSCAGGVAVFDTADFQRRLFVRGDYPGMLGFSPDSQQLAIPALESGVVRLWNIITNREVTVPVLRDPLTTRVVRFAPDGQRLVSGGPGGVRIWNLAGAAEKRALPGHDGGVSGLAFSPDGKLLASAGKDGTVRLWDPSTGQIVRELRGFKGPPQSVAFHPDGRFLATAEYTGPVAIWEVGSGVKLSTVPHDLGTLAFGTIFSPDGKQLVVCGMRGVKTWSVAHAGRGEDGRPQLLLKEGARPAQTFANSPCFSPDSKLLAWAGDWQIRLAEGISVWDLAAGQKRSWPATVFPFLALSFLPDSKQLVMVNWNEGKIEIRDAMDGQVTASFGKRGLIHGQSIHTALSPDGAWLAVGGDKAVTVWDINKHELLLALPEERGTVWSLAWSPNNDLLAVGSSTGSLVIWNLPRIKTEFSRIGLGW